MQTQPQVLAKLPQKTQPRKQNTLLLLLGMERPQIGFLLKMSHNYYTHICIHSLSYGANP